jgi:Type IV secretion-system coupling protein DNA-binding domain
LSLWCDQAAASILSLPPDLKRRFWVVLDEVASLQEFPALTPDGGLLTNVPHARRPHPYGQEI